MKLSTRTRYGTRALLELALSRNDEPVALKDIAARQQISLSYLEQLVAPLIAGGIIRSTKGAKGGISLVKTPRDIKLSEIVQIYEGRVSLVECVNDPGVCNRSDFCVTREVWSEMKMAMNGVLESTSLQDLVERHGRRGEHVSEMYYI